MEALKKRILAEASILPGDVLKTDSFMSHLVDINLMDSIGTEFHRLFSRSNANTVVTVEVSGIPVALSTARAFGVPCLIAKKGGRRSHFEDVYRVDVLSYVDKQDCEITIARSLLHRGIRALIIDDFLSTGNTLRAMISIVQNAGASIEGVGIVIEKAFQHGGDELRSQGVNLQSLCIVERIDNGIVFRNS